MEEGVKVAFAYVPALHKGYRDFFDALKKMGVQNLYLVSDVILQTHQEVDYIHRKDRLRALSQEDVLKAVSALCTLKVSVLTEESVEALQGAGVSFVAPNEDVSRFVARTYFPERDVKYLDIFLRWHRDNVGEDTAVKETSTIPLTDFQEKVFQDVFTEAAKSFDWWRQVGAALVKGGEVVAVTHNEHLPEEQLPNIIGDTRALFKKGVHINYVTSAHAEVAAIGAAAKQGIATEGAELYVTDFPCPYCARLIVTAGITKVFFVKGYAVLEGDAFLKDAGVEVVRVAL